MKLTLAILGGALLGFIGAVLGMDFGSEGTSCETIRVQERAGYQTVVQAQRRVIDDYTHRLDRKRTELVELQHDYARHLAEKIGKIDDVMAIKVDTEVASIANLAAKVAPIERAIKDEATEKHEFIPAAFRSYWGKVLMYGLMRGK